MLQYPDWLATSKTHDEVAFIAGGDRELTEQHKHLVVCTRTSCHAVAQPKHQVTFDPAFSRGGRLALVRDHAVQPTPANGRFGLTFTKKVAASGGLAFVVPFPHSHVVRLSSGTSASDPVWGRDGSMLVVKGRALWLLTGALNKATRVAGPLQVSSSQYYGFVAWTDSFAWSAAVR
jgi:hypothetical protein